MTTKILKEKIDEIETELRNIETGTANTGKTMNTMESDSIDLKE
ncbi:hypothetical protein ACFL35_19720 [Candidatus Riflebacteria bacterium]